MQPATQPVTQQQRHGCWTSWTTGAAAIVDEPRCCRQWTTATPQAELGRPSVRWHQPMECAQAMQLAVLKQYLTARSEAVTVVPACHCCGHCCRGSCWRCRTSAKSRNRWTPPEPLVAAAAGLVRKAMPALQWLPAPWRLHWQRAARPKWRTSSASLKQLRLQSPRWSVIPPRRPRRGRARDAAGAIGHAHRSRAAEQRQSDPHGQQHPTPSWRATLRPCGQPGRTQQLQQRQQPPPGQQPLVLPPPSASLPPPQAGGRRALYTWGTAVSAAATRGCKRRGKCGSS